MKKSILKKSIAILLICVLGLCLNACGSRGKGGKLPSTTLGTTVTSTPTASPTPTLTPTPTPEPSATPTPSPTPTPVPEYRDMTEEDYRTLFNRETSKEELVQILQFMPAGSYAEGIPSGTVKNAWELIYMTDSHGIARMFDGLQFDYENDRVAGDVSELLDWLGTVNNKGFYNDPSESSLTLDGTSVIISLSQSVHQDFYTPKILMGKVSEVDMYIYYSYSTDYSNPLPNVHRTAVFVKDGAGKYQLSEVTDRDAGSTAPAPPEYNFTFLSEGGNVLEDMLLSGGISAYLTQWNGDAPPSQYAVIDVDGDGTAELIVSSETNGAGFSTFAVLAYDTNTETVKLVMFQDPYGGESFCTMCHNGLRYSEEHHSLVYKSMNNGAMGSTFEYHGIQDGEESLLFSISSGSGAYAYNQDGEIQPLAGEQYQAYLDEAAPVSFQPLE